MAESADDNVAPTDGEVTEADAVLDEMEGTATTVSTIPVHISYEIIRLFSEGLYQSPQKAVEELVSNSYDAGATVVHVLVPAVREEEDDATPDTKPDSPLWVIDDGHGLNDAGFAQLWRVADSHKRSNPHKADEAGGDEGEEAANKTKERAPIGQFGIGKLAAYVLAWRLTHVSSVNNEIHMTTMDFRRLAGQHQYDNIAPLNLNLLKITEDEARRLLENVEQDDPEAWKLMFGEDRKLTWTAAGLSNFKQLYDKLSVGRLKWVLRAGLPLHSDFKISVNKDFLVSSKEALPVLHTYVVGGPDDAIGKEMGFTVSPTGVTIPGIEGEISGSATIYKKKLTEGKSDRFQRSNGFFIRVRGRVINLEDDLFGLPALNHAAWARFSLDVEADGLRAYLLSSREGVRATEETDTLRKYLQAIFNYCRREYEEWRDKELTGLDIQQLLRDAPSAFVTEPLVEGVQRVVDSGEESYYVAAPALPANTDRKEWMDAFADDVAQSPFLNAVFEATGVHDRAIRYLPDSRTLVINTDHPFVEKLLASGRTRAPAAYFGSSELLIDVLLSEHGVPRQAATDFLIDRDRVLRLVAGDEPSTAAEVIRLLQSAKTHDRALERAVGQAFRVLGFEYERRGGNAPGTDGVLYARLGRGVESFEDYKVVYDSKQTDEPAVPADKINLDSLEDFMTQENAQFGFFFANAYAGELKLDSKLSRLVAGAASKGRFFTLLRLQDLRRLVELHYRFGITLTQLRLLFVEAHTVIEVQAWIDKLEDTLTNQLPQVPLVRLLEGLEAAKSDALAQPNINYVRALDPELKKFDPPRLTASLQAVQTIVGSRWMEVDNSGNVRLHHTAAQIVAEVERNLRSLLGIDATERTAMK